MVAIVEFKTFALQDECAYAVLGENVSVASMTCEWSIGDGRHTLAVEAVRNARTGMAGRYRSRVDISVGRW